MRWQWLNAALVAALLMSPAAAQSGSPAANAPTDKPAAMETADPNADRAMESMQHRHMDMGPHMRMSKLRDAKPGDAERAAQVVDRARVVAEKYADYHKGLADGFKIFHPEVPQKQYHFTNYAYAFEAAFSFNPDHPTSLLYEKHGDDYKLVGVMYTAPKHLPEEDLDQRVPLSVAQWHQHINFCAPPQGHSAEMLGPNPKYGLRGSIATEEACVAASGTFKPVIFGWMVHLYPFEQKPEDIWAVERQMEHQHAE
jgi:hypothetical protein